MAAKMKHRKLFPNLTATNQTDCPDFCDPSCPYNCYPYDGFDFIPPPPPPPPPPTSEGQQVSPYVIIIVSSLAGFFLLVASYVIIVKYFSGWNPLRRPAPAQSDGQDEDLGDENIGPAIDHPIWYINTVGLQSSVINSITIFKYKKGDPLIEGRECSVCLTEFQDDETLRLLPKCNHAFHIPCIDTWLRSHTNCPLCRAGILSNTWSASLPSPSNEQSSLNLAQNDETQMENLDNIELGSRSEIRENRVETEDELVEVPRVDDERKELDDSKNRVNYSVLSGLEYKDMGVDDVQPVRRSVSMDSSSFSTLSLSVDSFCMAESGENFVNQRENLQSLNLGIVGVQDCANSRMNRVIGSPSISQSLRKSPVSMKRSFSCGARLFLSRYSRSSSSILPL